MIWSDTITFQLLTHDYFATFTPKPITNSRETVGMLIALSRDSPQEVGTIIDGRCGYRRQGRHPRAPGYGLHVCP